MDLLALRLSPLLKFYLLHKNKCVPSYMLICQELTKILTYVSEWTFGLVQAKCYLFGLCKSYIIVNQGMTHSQLLAHLNHYSNLSVEVCRYTLIIIHHQRALPSIHYNNEILCLSCVIIEFVHNIRYSHRPWENSDTLSNIEFKNSLQ